MQSHPFFIVIILIFFLLGLLFAMSNKIFNMKKLVLLGISFCFLLISNGQNARFGLKAGLNISNVYSNYTGSMDARSGLNAGALVNIPLQYSFSVQPEIYFSGQGAKYYSYNDGYEHQLVLNYVNVPLLLQYRFHRGLFIETGPQVGFLTSAKDKIGNFETGDVFNSDFKNVDFSWSFGLGYRSVSGLGVDVRYNPGISNINNLGNEILHNDVLQLGLFYLFNPSYTGKYKTKTRSHYRR